MIAISTDKEEQRVIAGVTGICYCDKVIIFF